MKKKRFLLLMIVIIGIFCSCSDNRKYCYYENGYIYSETFSVDSFLHKIAYFQNNEVQFKLFFAEDSLLQKNFEEYYFDGFPRNKCEIKNGIGIPPKEMGKISGYDINIDFGPYTTLDNGKQVRPFRTFVDGVDTDEYFVIFHDTCDIDTLAKKIPLKLREYVIICEGDTKTVSVDESLYTYYIDDLQRITFTDSVGRNYFYMDFYYKSALTPRYPNDSRLIIMHDSLNWEVREYDVKYVEE